MEVMPDTEAAVERIMAIMQDEWIIHTHYAKADGWPKARQAIREELAAAQRDGYVRALEAVPCDSDWMMADGYDCIEAKRRHMKQPDDSWPLCVRCKLLAEARET